MLLHPHYKVRPELCRYLFAQLPWFFWLCVDWFVCFVTTVKHIFLVMLLEYHNSLVSQCEMNKVLSNPIKSNPFWFSTGIKLWHSRCLNMCLIVAQVEHMSRKTPYLQPQSTLEPSSVSSSPPNRFNMRWCDTALTFNAFPFFSFSVLHLPSCSRFGETCLPGHAEQNRAGLWRGGSLWSVCSWQLQCESHTCGKMWGRSRSVWFGDA